MSEPPSKKQRICGTEEEIERFAKGDDGKPGENQNEGALPSEGPEERLETSRARRVFAVLGLGNPGSLKRERHSLGARVAAALVEAHLPISKDQKDCKDLDGAVWLQDFEAQVLVLQPQRSINDNGPQLHSALAALDLLDSPFLAIVDDCSLPLGTIRLRERGSSGGHKGLEGIEATFNCKQKYHRLRLGIGPEKKLKGENLKEFVTGSFTEEEEALLKPVLTAAVFAVEAWLRLGPEASQKIMSIVNAPSFLKDPAAALKP